MKLLKQFLKKNQKHTVLIFLLVVYLLFDIQTPDFMNPIIDNVLAYVVIFVFGIYVFMKSDMLIGVLVLLACYELVRRVSEKTGSSITKFLPSEMKKSNQFQSFNDFPVTLEEEIVNTMVPLVTHPASKNLNYEPESEDIHEASNIHDNNLL